MNRRGARLLSGLMAVLVVVITACSGQATGSPRPLTIGVIYPLSGPQGPGGHEELAGVRTALELARGQGGLSRSIELKVVDVQSADQARAAVDRLIDVDHVPLIIGTYASTLAEAAAEEADRRHTVFWETGAVSEGVTQHRSFVFRTVATGGALGRTAVDFTAKILLPAASLQPATARAVIVYVDDVYGRSVAQGEASRAAALHIQVVDRIAYDPHAYDPAAMIAQVKADHADYLWDVSYLDDGIMLWREVLGQQVPVRAAVGTSSAFCMPAFGQRLGKDALGVYAADKPDGEINPGALQADARSLLVQARHVYTSHWSGSMTIPVVAGFVGGWTLFHDVLPRVKGQFTPATVREAAFATDIPVGGSINGGGVRFAQAGEADAGQNRRAAAVVEQWQEIEQMRVVYPALYATATPRLDLP